MNEDKKRKIEALSPGERIERELQKNRKFQENLFSKFAKAIKDYELIQPGDKIAVCISGGKDSMIMAKLFQVLKRHNKFDFDVEFMSMDPGYNKENRKLLEKNAEYLGIPIKIFETPIFDAVDNIPKNPCYICARMRRGYLYREAQNLGCNKIALGHHFDDVIETIFMSMLWAGQFETMMPKLHSTNFDGMELIRPLYLVREEDIIEWCRKNDLHFLQCACHFTENCCTIREDGSSESKRKEAKHIIKKLKETNPYVEKNIFKTAENISLGRVIAYKDESGKHHFLDWY